MDNTKTEAATVKADAKAEAARVEAMPNIKIGERHLEGISAPPVTEKENEYVDATTGKTVGMFHMDVEKTVLHGVSLVRKDKWTAPKQVILQDPKPATKPTTK